MARLYGNNVTIGGNGGNYFYIDYSYSQDVSGNYSTIWWSCGFHYNSADAQLDNGYADVYGRRWTNGGRVYNFASNFTTRDMGITSGSFTVGHDANGNRSIDIGGAITAYNSGTSSGSTTLNLPSLARAPEITSNDPTSIALSSATGNGNVTWGGNSPISARGICYSTSQNPTTSSSKVAVSGTTGSFSASLTGLQPRTLYYYRAYVTNGVTTVYGANKSFTTLDQAQVSTTSASDVHGNTATLTGELVNNGYPTITEKGFVYGLNPAPTTAGSKSIVAGSVVGTYTANLTGLTQARTYYARAYAINSTGTVYGNEISFVTNAVGFAQGSLLFSGLILRKLKAHRALAGGMLLSGRAFGLRRLNPTMIEKKDYMWKVYDNEGNFKKVITDIVTSEPNWTEAINSTGSTTSVTLAMTADQINSEDNDYILHNMRVDCYAFYGEFGAIQDAWGNEIQDHNGDAIIGTQGAPNGIRRFSGFITEIQTNYGSEENTTIQLSSFGYDLEKYPLVTATGDTTVEFTAIDPAQMIRSGIAQFKVDGADAFVYTDATNASVRSTGDIASYKFRVNTYKELLETAIKLSPAGWTYRVDLGLNLIYFMPKPTEAQHTFVLGKHIKSLNVRSYIGDVVNDVLFTGGNPTPEIPDSPALFTRVRVPTGDLSPRLRRGLSRQSDSRVTVQSTAELLSRGLIDEKNLIQFRSSVHILDKVYDIESIQVGDLIAFKNFGNMLDTVKMQVVGKRYSPDVAELQLDTLPSDVNKMLDELRKSLNVTDNTLAPSTPTEIAI